jgi:hypothetical protein
MHVLLLVCHWSCAAFVYRHVHAHALHTCAFVHDHQVETHVYCTCVSVHAVIPMPLSQLQHYVLFGGGYWQSAASMADKVLRMT